jgi:hypothetical protein
MLSANLFVLMPDFEILCANSPPLDESGDKPDQESL